MNVTANRTNTDIPKHAIARAKTSEDLMCRPRNGGSDRVIVAAAR